MAEVEFDNIEELEYGEEKELPVLTCTHDVYIREAATKQSNAIGVINVGEKIEVLEDGGDWIRHERGWSMREFFK